MFKYYFVILTVVLTTSLGSTLVGCTNISQRAKTNTVTDPSYSASTDTTTTHTLKNVNVAADPASTVVKPLSILSLSVETGAGVNSLTQYCGLGTVNPCVCELKWNEINTVGNNSHTVARTKYLAVTEVQNGLVKCQMEDSFWSEIADGTSVTMNILPQAALGNLTGLSCVALAYKKGTFTTSQGDFFDSTLNPFWNVHHYTCYSRRSNSHEILNRQKEGEADPTNPAPSPAPSIKTNFLLSSRFCWDSESSSTECSTPRSGFSAQNYYRNLYVRSDKVGNINSHNANYDCPKVDESIFYSAGEVIPLSEKGKYWPLDSSFAVALTRSSEWSVGVRAASVLTKTGNPDYASDSCDGETNPAGTRILEKSVGIATKCLGYAKPPKADGSCGSITDNNGRVRPLTRLRRYRVIYPPTFKANGKVENGHLEADEVYVPDRLVMNNLGVATGDMIYGPKPCNFAWFDHEGMVDRRPRVPAADFKTHFDGGIPSYQGTNSYYYDNSGIRDSSLNPDGLILPNADIFTQGSGDPVQSCSASLPLVIEMMGSPSLVRLVTSHKSRMDKVTLGSKDIYLNEIHIRPTDPWNPEYIEDTSFQACVPISSKFTEPPLHIYSPDSGGGYMAWCAKNYPTQNPYWDELNQKRSSTFTTDPAQKFVGYPNAAGSVGVVGRQVRHWTSFSATDEAVATLPATLIPNHNSINGCAGTLDICSQTADGVSVTLAQCKTYLGENVARATCDRTVQFSSSESFRSFPLQAGWNEASHRDDITQMLKLDYDVSKKNFGCTYSVSTDKTKIGTRSPASGCCGVYNGSKVLDALYPFSAGGNHVGHLEPFINSQFPNIRFCGNPVD